MVQHQGRDDLTRQEWRGHQSVCVTYRWEGQVTGVVWYVTAGEGGLVLHMLLYMQIYMHEYI